MSGLVASGVFEAVGNGVGQTLDLLGCAHDCDSCLPVPSIFSSETSGCFSFCVIPTAAPFLEEHEFGPIFSP
jgi:hypothetical protein